jgi:hypothetical protein
MHLHNFNDGISYPPRRQFNDGSSRPPFHQLNHPKPNFRLLSEDFPPLGTGESGIVPLFSNSSFPKSLANNNNLVVNSSFLYPTRMTNTNTHFTMRSNTFFNGSNQMFNPGCTFLSLNARDVQDSWSNAVKRCIPPVPIGFPQMRNKIHHKNKFVKINMAAKIPNDRIKMSRTGVSRNSGHNSMQNSKLTKSNTNGAKQLPKTFSSNNFFHKSGNLKHNIQRKYVKPLFDSDPFKHKNAAIVSRKNVQNTVRSNFKWVPAKNTVRVTTNQNMPIQGVPVAANRFSLLNRFNDYIPNCNNHLPAREEGIRPIKTIQQPKRQPMRRNAVRPQPDMAHRKDILPEHVFNAAKRMSKVLKCSHHLDQLREGYIPKQVGREATRLASFAKPFANENSLETKFSEIADDWSTSFCSILREHYNRVRNTTLWELESTPLIDDRHWEKASNLAIKWARNSHKNKITNECIKECLELLDMAHKKSLTSLSNDDSTPPQNETAAEENFNDYNDLTRPYSHQPAIEEDHTNEENVEHVEITSSYCETVVRESTANEEGETIATTNVTDSDMNNLTENNVKLLPIGQKSRWRVPTELLGFKKVLITDENFITPVTTDFFHLIMQKGTLWDLYNVINNSKLNEDTSLILIHLGYKPVSKNNLRYCKTIVNKIKKAAPNVKIFFTNLLNLQNYDKIDEFNAFCSENIADFFLNVNIDNVNINCKEEYSAQLFQKWNTQITHLNW